MQNLIARAGEVPLPPLVCMVLGEPIEDKMVSIKPTGVIYVGHNFYRDRLDKAFGVGGWVHVPLAPIKREGNEVAYYGMLKAHGQYIGDAVGSMEWKQGNSEMTYSDCIEGAKSESLKRCCKMLPMFRELWDPNYQAHFKSTYCEYVAMPNTKSGKGWRIKAEFRGKFEPRADVLPPDRKLNIQRNDAYNDNAEYYDDGREEE